MENQFETYAGQQEELFTDLYNRIKDQLSQDAAAALWFSVNALQANFGNLATKIMFENQSKETAAILIDITNENSGTVTTATYAAGGKTYLTEPGTYKVEPQADNLLIIPKTFVLDHTQTTETLNFTIYDKTLSQPLAAMLARMYLKIKKRRKRHYERISESIENSAGREEL